MSRLFFKNVDRSRVYIPDLKERGFDTERLIIPYQVETVNKKEYYSYYNTIAKIYALY